MMSLPLYAAIAIIIAMIAASICYYRSDDADAADLGYFTFLSVAGGAMWGVFIIVALCLSPFVTIYMVARFIKEKVRAYDPAKS
jgi:hypothetical protein